MGIKCTGSSELGLNGMKARFRGSDRKLERERVGAAH